MSLNAGIFSAGLGTWAQPQIAPVVYSVKASSGAVLAASAVVRGTVLIWDNKLDGPNAGTGGSGYTNDGAVTDYLAQFVCANGSPTNAATEVKQTVVAVCVGDGVDAQNKIPAAFNGRVMANCIGHDGGGGNVAISKGVKLTATWHTSAQGTTNTGRFKVAASGDVVHAIAMSGSSGTPAIAAGATGNTEVLLLGTPQFGTA